MLTKKFWYDEWLIELGAWDIGDSKYLSGDGFFFLLYVALQHTPKRTFYERDLIFNVDFCAFRG